MSNASSIGSSLDTPCGSYSAQESFGPDGANPRASGSNVASQSDDVDRDLEPMFNFRSLAEIVGVNIDDGSARPAEGAEPSSAAKRPLSQVDEDEKAEAEAEHVEERTVVNPLLPSPEADIRSGEESSNEAEKKPAPALATTAEPSIVGPSDNNQLGQYTVEEHIPSVSH